MDNPQAVLVDAGVSLPEAPPPPPVRSPPNSQPSSRRPTRSGSKLLSLATGSKFSSSKSPSSPTIPASAPRALQRTTSKKAEDLFVCQICFSDAPGQTTLALDCDHVFCSECWKEYVIAKIKDEGEYAIRCMAEGCGLVAPDTFIHTLLTPEPGAPIGNVAAEEDGRKAWARFQELIVRHFVGCNRNLKFCPYPSCTNTVSCPSASSKSSLSTVVPIVSCGARGIGSGNQAMSASGLGLGLQGKEHKFCFGCDVESDHRPVICPVARMWLRKCRDDSETANWIKSNTKECSNCQSTIEKNGGCK